MVYVGPDGTVCERRSPWRASIVLDVFWAIVDFVHFFFRSMIDPESAHHSLRPRSSSSRRGGGGGGGGGPSGGGGRPKRGVRGMGDLGSSRMSASVAGG